MRIDAGILKGRRLPLPKGMELRPTSDKVKQAMFNILAPWIPGARVLDLFCGSGNLGVEALSRGALSVCFVDKERESVESVRRFLDACGEAGLGRAAFMPMQAGKALNILAASRESFDLVLMDPPYDSTAGSSILQSSQLVAILSPQASSRVVLEHPGNAEIQAGAALEILRSYRYGGTCLTIFKPAGS